MAQFTRSFEIQVANLNQTPRLLPLPLQLVRESDTLGFTVRAADPDGDAVSLALIHDAATPAGIHFDPATGTFEWTPDQNNRGSDHNFLSRPSHTALDRRPASADFHKTGCP
jgi:hypothetical protein